MRVILSSLVFFASMGFWLCPTTRGEVWMETSQADFADGRVPGGLGASIYASASGAVRMVGNTCDLNQDGYKDIIFCNRHNDVTRDVQSYVYWGSAWGYNPLDVDSLPTHGACGSSVSDLNRDGFPDLVLSNSFTDGSVNIDSYVYWGSAAGYDPTDVGYLPTHFAHGNTVADLNNDGYLDIVFCNYTDDVTYNISSCIYWGSASGYSPAKMTLLPTRGAFEAVAADVDEDGYLDLVFSNHNSGTTHILYSYIYWGSATGYSPANKDSLFTQGALGISIADLDDDEYLDIIVSNYFTGTTRNIYSYIYWGSVTGYHGGDLDSLPTHGALGSSVADLNGDGYLDLVFSNHSNDTTYDIYSYIYWGSSSGYNGSNRDSLPTHGAYGNFVADLNDDGHLDIVFLNYRSDVTCNIHSYVYWGTSAGYSVLNMDSLPTHGASLGVEKDLGGIYRRDSTEVYTSSVFDAGDEAVWDSITWIASTPLGSSVSILVRTGDTVVPDITWSGWVSVSNGGNIPDSLDSRRIQYAALMTTNYEGVPSLEETRIEWRPLDLCDPVEPWRTRSQGYWRSLCRSEGKEDLCMYVDSVHYLADFFDGYDCDSICDLLNVNPPENDMCRKARRQFMALLLNVGSGKLAVCNCLEDGRELGDVIAEIDSVLSRDPDFHACERAKTLADDINKGISIVPCDTVWAQVPPRAVGQPSVSIAPNPFSKNTVIEYEVKTPGPVRLEIYDISGRLVETLVDETQQPGICQVRWNKKGNPSGVYFYRLKSGEFVETRKMVVVD